ncbi:MAG: MarR family transcriptional regulator [Ruminococcaceae bacterium]|nr:MarR family transcriptional regulator [Oscillospiraceae bacterium]
MAYSSLEKNIFGRKINAPHKNVRAPITPTAVTAMREVADILEANLENIFSQGDVKEGYRHILMVLGMEDGISQLSIAKQTSLKPSTVSIALKKMEREGYITRVNDSKDMRMSRVYLTEMGLDVANRAYAMNENIGNILLSGISKEDLDTVMTVVAKMKANYAASEYAVNNEDK